MAPVETTSNVRTPAVAGLFYPDDPGQLRRVVTGFLDGAIDPSHECFKCFILPHAGYIYSGPVAGTGYRQLRPQWDRIRRVVILGPSHRMAFRGLAFSSHSAFATPLGTIPVDEEAIDAVRDLPQVVELDPAHQQEHSVEVHLPFLQVVFRDFKLVPLVVGDARETEVAEAINCLWGGEETCFVISSDLSHFHDYQTAGAEDRRTADRIQSLKAVVPDQACGAVPLNGLLHVGRERGLKMRLLDLRNSGDTAGPRNRVVGYGAFAMG